MSLEKDYIVHDTHTRSITALGFSQARREIYLGFEDGIIKSLEMDTGNYAQTYNEHKGWITAFLYWPQTKLLFCSANDSLITVIGAGGNLMDRVFVGVPVYSMAFNSKREDRQEIILGVTNAIQFHRLSETREGYSHYIDPKPLSVIREHTDIVRCMVVLDSRIYSAGYDGALVIYECRYSNKNSATKSFKNSHAHHAGILCLSVDKDGIENNVWVLTGSFDKTLKIWTSEGKLVHKFDGFLFGVTGICYVPKNKTICLVSGSGFIYDPKSGEDVTEFVDTFIEETQNNLQLIKYLTEYNIMLVSTSRRQLIVYKYNPSGCLTSLKCKQPIDSVCYTSKVPILTFTGDSTGCVFKWEQRQSNDLIYSSQTLLKSELAERESSSVQGQAKVNNNRSKANSANLKLSQVKKTNTVLKLIYVESMDLLLAACEDACIYVWGYDEEGIKILKDMNKNTLQNDNDDDDDDDIEEQVSTGRNLKVYDEFVRKMNYEDDDFADHMDEQEKRYSEEQMKKRLQEHKKNKEEEKKNLEVVRNRVAGFKLLKILCEHTSCVTSMVFVERPEILNPKSEDRIPNKYLLSAGWDRRVIIWDMERLKLFGLFRNTNVNNFDEVELASDGNILDMCYCDKYNLFAYASTDTYCYIRRFANQGANMTLVSILKGHMGDVNCIKWLDTKDVWITGGEDATIRIWSHDGIQLEFLNTSGSVNSFCFDFTQNVIIAACHDFLKIYDLEKPYNLLQTNAGHHDSIRDVCFIPERKQIVSVSWDRTVKIWKSFGKSNKTQQKTNTDENYEVSFWDQMKRALKEANLRKEDNNTDYQ